MIKSLKVTNPNTGEFLTLELKRPDLSGFIVKKIEGLGPVKSIINTSESLYGDGGTFNSARLSQRNLLLDLDFYFWGSETIESLRNKTYRFFPMKTDILIEVETDSRIGVLTGQVEDNDVNIFSSKEGTLISILCPDPYYYAKDPVITLFSGVNSSFEFPFENLSLVSKVIEFGAIFINTQASLFYTGDSPTGVLIYINFVGAVNNLTIHNTITGENMAINSTKLIALTGSNFVAGDRVIISTIKGNKYIYLLRAGVLINILNTIDIISDWFQVKKGDNVFTYTAASGLGNLQFYIEHRPIYDGV